jgi:hypothetical protein
MKKELSIIGIILTLSFGLIALGATPISVLAQPTSTETPLETTTPGAESLVATDSASTGTPSDIRKLRDRLASVVAELRKKDEQVIAGEVKSIDTTNLEVDTISSIVEKIQIDDTLTKYYRISGAAKEEITQKDVKQGSYVIVTGLRTEGSFSANEIYIDEPFDSKAGRITEIDSNTNTFKLETFDKETLTVVINKSAYQEYLNPKTAAVEQGGFTKMKEGDTAHVVYALKSIKSQTTTITPARILVIPVGYFSK